jgi:hypothetical protein
MPTVLVYRMSCLQCVYRMSCLQYVSTECHVYSMSLQNAMSIVCVHRMSFYSMSPQNVMSIVCLHRMSCLRYVSTEFHVYSTCLQHVTQTLPIRTVHEDSIPFSYYVTFCRLATIPKRSKVPSAAIFRSGSPTAVRLRTGRQYGVSKVWNCCSCDRRPATPLRAPKSCTEVATARVVGGRHVQPV